VAAVQESLQLPVVLRKVLVDIPDLDLQERLEKVFLAAARAIAHLRDLDLARYETSSFDEAGNLSMWEEVAPVLAATVGDVNVLVSALEESFPEDYSPPTDDVTEAERTARVDQLLRDRGEGLRADVVRLGARLRSPQAMSDRWNLLGALQGARGRLRAGIGQMVADVASLFADVSKSAVIPEYDRDLQNAVALRRTLVRLTASVQSSSKKVREAATPAEVAPSLDRLLELLDRIGATDTWNNLRAPDKLEFLRFRSQAGELKKKGHPPAQVRAVVEGFLRFLELLSAVINQREALQESDRYTLAELSTRLEHAEGQLAQSPTRAKEEVAAALAICERLCGRDPDLDKFVATARSKGSLPPAEQIQALRRHAARLLVG
jgi:hypothetical protein